MSTTSRQSNIYLYVLVRLFIGIMLSMGVFLYHIEYVFPRGVGGGGGRKFLFLRKHVGTVVSLPGDETITTSAEEGGNDDTDRNNVTTSLVVDQISTITPAVAATGDAAAAAAAAATAATTVVAVEIHQDDPDRPRPSSDKDDDPLPQQERQINNTNDVVDDDMDDDIELVLLDIDTEQQQLDGSENNDSSKSAAGRDNNNNINTKKNKKKVMYSWARYDRSGSFVRDMMFAHAYAYHHNMSYGGACACDYFRGIGSQFPEHVELINGLGLQTVLKLACPWDNDEGKYDDIDDGDNKQRYLSPFLSTHCPPGLEDYAKESITLRDNDNNVRNDHEEGDDDDNAFVIMGGDDYNAGYISPLTDTQYLEYLQSLVQYPPPPTVEEGRRRPALQIAAHIRRGDVTPCGTYAWRYYSNSYYIDLLQREASAAMRRSSNNNDRDVRVTIYSELESYEPWTDFERLSDSNISYTLQLGGSVVEAWYGMIRADVLIMSKSAFSSVPAMLNRNGRVIEPNLKRWQVVRKSNELCQRGQEEQHPEGGATNRTGERW